MIKFSKRLALEAVSFYLRTISQWRFREAIERCAKSLAKDVSPLGRIRTIRCEHSFKLKTDVTHYIGRQLFTTGVWEPTVGRAIKAILGPGDIFVDVGANHGYFTVMGSKAVGSSGKVYAFEPSPNTRSRLMTNLEINNISNCIVREEAISDRDDTIDFFEVTEGNDGASSLFRHPGIDASSIQVKTVPLSSVIPQDEKIRLIKIDVEGAEGHVLTAMRQRLDKDRSFVIVELTEPWLKEQGFSVKSLGDSIIDLGYSMFVLEHGGATRVTQTDHLPDKFEALFSPVEDLPDGLRVNLPSE